MDPIIKAKWVKALRSGRYRQAKGQLWVDDLFPPNRSGYCCLGVLMAEAMPNTLEEGKWGRAYTGSACNNDFRELGMIPDDIAVLWDLDLDAQEELTGLNDERDWSFKRIATWIEKHL